MQHLWIMDSFNPSKKQRMCVWVVCGLVDLTWLSWPVGDPETLSVWHLKLRRVLCCEARPAGAAEADAAAPYTINPRERPAGAAPPERCSPKPATNTHTNYFPHTNHSLENKLHSLFRVLQSESRTDYETKTPLMIPVCNLHYQNNDASVIMSRFTQFRRKKATWDTDSMCWSTEIPTTLYIRNKSTAQTVFNQINLKRNACQLIQLIKTTN